MAPHVDLERRIGAEDLTAVPAPVLEEGFPLLCLVVAVLARAEVGQVVGQKPLTGIVEDALRFLLQQLQ